MATHPRDAASFNCPAIDRDKFANLIVIPNLQPRRFAGITNILRRHSNGTEREKFIVRAYFCWSLDSHVGDEMTAFSNLHLRPDHTIGANLAGRVYLCTWINYGGGMKVHDFRKLENRRLEYAAIYGANAPLLIPGTCSRSVRTHSPTRTVN